uniref:Uncharacterized protein n=1 Tax=Heliothis virescens TaxID=7102 RepID=A0A2A4IRR4_HELVI
MLVWYCGSKKALVVTCARSVIPGHGTRNVLSNKVTTDPYQDGAEPSGNSVSCHNLQRLAAYADKSAAPEGGERERELAVKLLKAFSKRLTDAPTSLPEMMSALMFFNDSPTQVLIAGGCSDPRTLELVRVTHVIILLALTSYLGLLRAFLLLSRIRSVGDVPTAYVCRRYACSLPVTDVKQLENLLDEPPAAPSTNNK